ncbi:efflux RND transporter periplasmic adaptor subunit [Ralstonia pseudosolanacearum]|uniref:efflux RND transporter periplasmic adaptor subunit n=1 Tax=Ralstonia pseudosolanacearum TaxID=1310165 RepID=UPI0018D17002|nr:efflux RND transporter periplasmic adaptor subunit [Ralstonia pseudosolanacearum]UWD88354.1 efflux RND transporter periplasmic adaptor subunit [Ralstonia pseudosolanacearum]
MTHRSSSLFSSWPSRRFAAVAAAAVLLLGACGKDGTDAAKAAQQAADPNVVVAPPALTARLKVAPAGQQAVSERLRVPGQIDFDEQRVARIGASVTGRVTELLVVPGQQVKAGDILAQLHSTELGTAQLAYQKAVAQRDLQARALERAKLLLAADVIGSAELQKRQSELAMAEAEVRAAVDQLRVMGVSMRTGGMSSISPVVASLGGTVVERKVTRGQVVQPADALFTVADLSRVWVVGQVPESAAPLVRAGQAVEIETGAPGERIVGKLIWVSDIVDPQTRTVTVRTEVDNPERALKPSMLATLLIESRPEQKLVVPTSAVVREDNRDYVFVQASPTDYRLVPVKLGDESNGVRPVTSGLQAGQPIVVDGGFHLNNERKRAEMEGA